MNFLQGQKLQEVEEMEIDREPTAVIKGQVGKFYPTQIITLKFQFAFFEEQSGFVHIPPLWSPRGLQAKVAGLIEGPGVPRLAFFQTPGK